MRADPAVRRVLMTADGVGGVWTYALALARELKARRVHVRLAVMGPLLHESQRAEAAALGIDLVDEPFRLEWMADPWDDVDRAGEWLLSLAGDHAPDIVHLNGFCHAALPWNVPCVVVGHSCVRTWWRGVNGEPPPRAWDTYTERVREGLRAAHLVIAPTRALLDELQAEYGGIDRSRVIPNGSTAVDSRAAAVVKEPLVLSAGRLWDEAKNVASLCAAASDVSWRTCIAGDAHGPSGRFLSSGGACVLGRLSSSELAEWYRRASIYALPARYEPFGLSVVEAAAAGCALVLGDIRTLRENWSGAATFVPPDNRRALARAIEDLIRNPEQRHERAALARERAARFTVNAMTDAYLDAYNALLASAAAA